MTPTAALPRADVRRPEDRFRCAPYACVLSARSCLLRQDDAASGGAPRYGHCRACPDGQAVRAQLGAAGARVDHGVCTVFRCKRPATTSGRCAAHGAYVSVARSKRAPLLVAAKTTQPAAHPVHVVEVPAPSPPPLLVVRATPPHPSPAPRSTMPASPISAAAVAAIRSLSPELVGALALEHATDGELAELMRRALTAPDAAPLAARPEAEPRARAPRAKPAPKSAPRAASPRQHFTPDDERAVLVAAAGKPVAAGDIARAIGRTPNAVRPLCARLVKAGKLVASGATSQRRYQAAA